MLSGVGGIESLRAIPWTFAWAQTRLNLSAWLGAGAGLTGAVSFILLASALLLLIMILMNY
jgi:phosphoenolpyruvate carboxylase